MMRLLACLFLVCSSMSVQAEDIYLPKSGVYSSSSVVDEFDKFTGISTFSLVKQIDAIADRDVRPSVAMWYLVGEKEKRPDYISVLLLTSPKSWVNMKHVSKKDSATVLVNGEREKWSLTFETEVRTGRVSETYMFLVPVSKATELLDLSLLELRIGLVEFILPREFTFGLRQLLSTIERGESGDLVYKDHDLSDKWSAEYQSIAAAAKVDARPVRPAISIKPAPDKPAPPVEVGAIPMRMAETEKTPLSAEGQAKLARFRLEQAKKLIERGRSRDAEKTLRNLIEQLPDAEASTEARQILERLK